MSADYSVVMLWPDDIEGPEKVDVVAVDHFDAVKKVLKVPMVRLTAQLMERQWALQIIAPGTALDQMRCVVIKTRTPEVC